MSVTQDIATVLGSTIGSALAILGLAWLTVRRVRPWVHVMDDLVGEEARPGRPAEPGVMARLARAEGLNVTAVAESTGSKQVALRVERLLLKHMHNTATLQQAFHDNEELLYDALAEHGITVDGRADYPPVETDYKKFSPYSPPVEDL